MAVFCEEFHKADHSRNIYAKNGKKVVIGNEQERSLKPFEWLKHAFVTVFLPEGYPQSVSDDYFDYQLWDSLQAFASSVTNTLATHSILKGIGVGDSNATPIAATITWLLRDGTGMLGRIAFAYLQGSNLDADCKKWRLFADILNDFSIGIDIITPLFVKWTTGFQCISALGRSLVGTAGGATRAALTQHQARRNNLADVSAKDGSQETIVNLIALLFSLTVVPIILTSTSLVWITFIFLTLFHIYANYRAVRAVSLEVVNLTRFIILVENYLKNGTVLSVKEVNAQENVIPFLRSKADNWRFKIGVSLSEHLDGYSDLKNLLESSRNFGYVLSVNWKKTTPINISLYENEKISTILKASFHAIVIHFRNNCKPTTNKQLASVDSGTSSSISETESFTEDTFNEFFGKAVNEGWDFSRILIPVDEWRIKEHIL